MQEEQVVSVEQFKQVFLLLLSEVQATHAL